VPTSPLHELEALLGESLNTVIERERNAFDRAAAPFSDSVVIFGAGGLGRRVVGGLRNAGIQPLAFADNNQALWGRVVDGLDVLPPEAAAERFGDRAAFVVAVWNPALPVGIRALIEQLSRAGCRNVIPFLPLFWKYPGTFLPNYLFDLPSRLMEHGAELREAYALLADDVSRDMFVRQLRFRLRGDFFCLPIPDAEPQYFPVGIYRPLPEECFIDCGAFDGDTIRAFARRTEGRFRKAIAFESDPENFRALAADVASEPTLRGRVEVHPLAVAAAQGKVRFSGTGAGNASISESGDIEVDSIALDEFLSVERPTLLKMDIEGAELDALEGSAGLIREASPVLAICLYHSPQHLWRIPLRLCELQPAYRFFLRAYCADGLDLVCYAVPESRLA
jgi:FkbM family methyltransferase